MGINPSTGFFLSILFLFFKLKEVGKAEKFDRFLGKFDIFFPADSKHGQKKTLAGYKIMN